MEHTIVRGHEVLGFGPEDLRDLAQDLSHHNTGARHHTEEGIEK